MIITILILMMLLLSKVWAVLAPIAVITLIFYLFGRAIS
jgi:hypothetical protein